MYFSTELRDRIRTAAADRCGYCQSPQHLVLGTLEIEHILPRSRGGTSDESNLWLACRVCNNFKSDRIDGWDPRTGQVVALFEPRRQMWFDHFRWSLDGTRIIGRTTWGRATVITLQLNNVVAVTVRRYWVSAGWHPPEPANQ